MKKLNFMWMLVVACMGILSATSSCSKDDDDDKMPDTEPAAQSIVGKWICYDDAYGMPWDEPLVYMFAEDGTGYEWFQDEPFSERYEFNYAVSGSRIVLDDGYDTTVLRYEISNNGNQLIIYGLDDNDMAELHFVRADSSIPTTRDELSNTKWMLKSITGDAASASAEWKGEILEFGPNGSVTEIYNDGGSGKGTYTLSGNKIKFTGIGAWTNSWGYEFTYSLSGKSLKLYDSFGSTFNFEKK